MDDESLKNLTTWSMKLYESFAPVREFIKEHPETKDEIVATVAKVMTNSFASNFYGSEEEILGRTLGDA
jgi:hypothetical protein